MLTQYSAVCSLRHSSFLTGIDTTLSYFLCVIMNRFIGLGSEGFIDSNFLIISIPAPSFGSSPSCVTAFVLTRLISFRFGIFAIFDCTALDLSLLAYRSYSG